MRKLKILILLVLLSISVKAQNENSKNNGGITLYEQQFKDLVVTYIKTYDNNNSCYSTILRNIKSGKELILKQDSIKTSDIHSDNIVNRVNIMGSILDEKDLYVIYYWAGLITFTHYHFTSTETFETSDKVIRAFMDYGGTGQFGSSKRIKDIVYFYLYSYPNQGTEDLVDMFSLNLKTSLLKKIEFKNQKYIYMFYIDEDTKDMYNRKSDYSVYPDSFIDRVNYMKENFFEKPYYIRELSAEQTTRNSELRELNSYETLEYTSFENSDISNKKIFSKEAIVRIEEVLSFLNKNKTKIKLLDYIIYGDEISAYNATFQPKLYIFFYKDSKHKISTIRYTTNNSIWRIGDFLEEDFDPIIGR